MEKTFIITAAANTKEEYWVCNIDLFHSDNLDIWKTGTTKSSDIMTLVCMLYFCATLWVNLIIIYNAGVNNTIAKALRCFQVAHF